MSRTANRIKAALFTWALLLAASLIMPTFIEPTGSSFVRGLNRLIPSFWLQGVGFLIASWSAVVTFRNRAEIATWLRIAGLFPILLYFTAVLLFIFSATRG